MADPFETLRTRLRRESAEADQELLRTIREESTEADRQTEWARWRGVSKQDTSRRGIWFKELAELWVALSAARIPQRTAMVAMVLLIAAIGWWQFRSDLEDFRTPAASLTAGGLPPTLRVSVQKGRATLEDAGRTLSALLNSPRRGAGLNVFDVDYSGADAQGNRVSFKGTMVVTNLAGVTSLKKAGEISGVLLEGELTVGNQPPVPIRQPYLP